MKALLIITGIVSLLLFSQSTFGVSVDTNAYTVLPKEVKKEFSRHISFPDEAKRQHIEGDVLICFYITPEGSIDINCINGPPVLKEGVLNNLNKLHFKNTRSYANKKMMIKFSFLSEK